MFIATTPPAAHASAQVCADDKPQNLQVAASAVLYSPDCRWVLAFKSDMDKQPGFPLATPLGDDIAIVAETRTHRILYRFSMDRDASAHWLKDGRHLIVNYYSGSGYGTPLAFTLTLKARGNPADLATLVFPDALKRIHKRRAQVFHYYVYFLKDVGDRVTISAEPDFTTKGTEGPGDGLCLIYSIDKATFRHYRYVKSFAPDDAHPCPQNSDETYD